MKTKQNLLLLIGMFISTSVFSQDYSWAKPIRGTHITETYDMYTSPSGNIYITGYFNDTSDFDPSSGQHVLITPGTNTVFVAKYDSLGALVWANALTGTGNSVGQGIVQNQNGDLIVTGYFDGTIDFDPSPTGVLNLTSAGGSDMFLACFSSLGNLKWCHSFGGNGMFGDEAYAVCTDNAGKIYFTGCFQGNVDFDPSPSNTILSTTSNFYDLDMVVGCFDSLGNFNWAIQATGPMGDVGRSIHVHGNQLLVGGQHSGPADFDPGAGNTNAGSAGNDHAFLASYTLTGNYNWVHSFGGAFGGDAVNSIATNAAGEIYICGRFYSTADFDPGPGTFNLSVNNSTNYGFLAKYTNTGGLVWALPVFLNNAVLNECTDLTVTPHGDVWVTGYNQYNLIFNTFVANYSTNGFYQWDFTLNGGDNTGSAIGLDADTNVYVSGACYADLQTGLVTVDFDPSAGTAYLSNNGMSASLVYMAKYNSPTINSIKEIELETLGVFPNPTEGIFFIRLEEETEIEIYNTVGAQVWNETIKRGEQTIDIRKLPAGMYIIYGYETGSGKQKSARLIKQ